MDLVANVFSFKTADGAVVEWQTHLCEFLSAASLSIQDKVFYSNRLLLTATHYVPIQIKSTKLEVVDIHCIWSVNAHFILQQHIHNSA